MLWTHKSRAWKKSSLPSLNLRLIHQPLWQRNPQPEKRQKSRNPKSQHPLRPLRQIRKKKRMAKCQVCGRKRWKHFGRKCGDCHGKTANKSRLKKNKRQGEWRLFRRAKIFLNFLRHLGGVQAFPALDVPAGCPYFLLKCNLPQAPGSGL